MKSYDLIVIGGGAAGFSAVLQGKKFNRKAKILLISQEREFYSRCALPFVISGEIKSFKKISYNLKELCHPLGIDLLIDEAIKIIPREKKVKTKQGKDFFYNSLIIATGSKAFLPKIKGIKKEGVFTLKNLEDGKKILEKVRKVKRVVVIGGGTLGVEIAAILKELGKEVTLIELQDWLLSSCFSSEFSQLIKDKLKEKGIKVITKGYVEKILGKEKVKGVEIKGKKIKAELVIIATGMKANLKLAQEAGTKIEQKAIKVNEKMETSLPKIYAAGDCLSFQNLLTKKFTLSQLGTLAMREGKIAAINALGGKEKLKGVLNSLVLRIFDLEIGRTGLTEEEAKQEGFSIVVGKAKTFSKEEYYPTKKELFVKIIFNQADKKILGAEIIGGEGIAERIDLVSLAIQKNLIIEDLLNLEYCYTPSLISSHNALVLAAENAKRKLERIKKLK